MKLQFNPSLDYQQEAIQAVVDVFKGQILSEQLTTFSNQAGSLNLPEYAVGNILTVDEQQLLENVQTIQNQYGLCQTTALDSYDFSIEMETGTGKTYVYLRTIFELNKIYGFKKFVIVVPSLAVREGVLKSIQTMKEHFRELYNNSPFSHFVYDSSHLGKLREFSQSNNLQIMIINIQSFQRDENIFNQAPDRFGSYSPQEIIAATRSIVIIDEPQSVDSGEKSRKAILSLNALVTLRYSATHKNLYNLLYQLGPIEAYERNLVKRIEVLSVTEESGGTAAYIKLLDVDNTQGICARVEIHQLTKKGGAKKVTVWIKKGDDLFAKSNGYYPYEKGFTVTTIDCTPGEGYIEFSNGKFVFYGEEVGTAKKEILKAQIYETVKRHFKKEKELKNKGIKVLSLFFIDRVSNYRIYKEDGTIGLGPFAIWFEEAFCELSAKEHYKDVIKYSAHEVHSGYFSQDRQDHFKDTSGISKDDSHTYNLIMKEKEQLLNMGEPLRFIFSHSALKEGWDNPNVFQICTLNETKSTDKKRQEIGRGLRLPVNSMGERIYDSTVNVLTVIANESYENFAKTLQKEFEEDGIQFEKKYVKNAHNESIVKPTKQLELNPSFKEIWEKIKHKTLYKVYFDTEELIKKVVEKIHEIPKIQPLCISASRVELQIDKKGITEKKLEDSSHNVSPQVPLPDILNFLQNHLELTRHTLAEILKKCGRLNDFKTNPHLFMTEIIKVIKSVLSDMMVNQVSYRKIEDFYEMRLEEFRSYRSRTMNAR